MQFNSFDALIHAGEHQRQVITHMPGDQKGIAHEFLSLWAHLLQFFPMLEQIADVKRCSIATGGMMRVRVSKTIIWERINLKRCPDVA